MADIGFSFFPAAQAAQSAGLTGASGGNDGLEAARERSARLREQQRELADARQSQGPATPEESGTLASNAVTGTAPTSLLSTANAGLVQNAAMQAQQNANPNALTLPVQARTGGATDGTAAAGQAPPGQANAQANAQAPGGEEQAQPGASGEDDGPGAANLTPEERQQVQQLQQRDQEVRRHEAAHAAAGGQFAGAPQFTFETGPNGQQYAVGGEVSISVPSGGGSPEETIAQARVVRAAALAPAEPSAQDLRVAAEAQRQAASAQAELRQQQIDENSETGADGNAVGNEDGDGASAVTSSTNTAEGADTGVNTPTGAPSVNSGDPAGGGPADGGNRDAADPLVQERASTAIQADRAFAGVQEIQSRIAESLASGAVTRSFA